MQVYKKVTQYVKPFKMTNVYYFVCKCKKFCYETNNK